ncbi:metalloendopeptidase OMA1, mitochondrial [Lingula anatina]|uniref:Metalloendopeptidase OMA1, mitochondrial n=1 Tax=Lingula anatina TaxID=7574 RepID=A0A1S3JFD7_LINAN|nr:metalloendopeptidase OMA1, mitochondrial [Lingula anatina]XP_013409128.1 metalloendopeptidase OMA1, mitochondrial [Lingula anatina]XP_013409129.1 metalloendopeptidase OMA1, mitochondrial [Lingula anatina]|eukprot:XP_013409127.1 metalloendopeptidase OMA1, mitochondrial [Lingula anatina]
MSNLGKMTTARLILNSGMPRKASNRLSDIMICPSKMLLAPHMQCGSPVQKMTLSLFANNKQSGLSFGRKILECNIRLKVQNSFRSSLFCRQSRGFHTTRPMHAPQLAIVKIIVRVVGHFLGWLSRKVWVKLDQGTKKVLCGLLIFILFLGTTFMWYHVKVDPSTGEWTVKLLTDTQLMEIAKEESYREQLRLGDQILPQDHPYTQVVRQTVLTLLNGNEELQGLHKWRIAVVDDDENINAFVLPNGDIYVFTGLLKSAHNIDQLAVVLAHELAHCVLGHGSLKLNQHAFWEIITLCFLVFCWLFIGPFQVAFVTQYFFDKATEAMFHMPYSRKLEFEADNKGLQLAAKACFDVRESSVFWNMMHMKDLETGNVMDILSTHPRSDERADKLDDLVPQALELRTSCNCPTLRGKDPRAFMKALRLEAVEQANQSRNNSNESCDGNPAVGGLREQKVYVSYIKENKSDNKQSAVKAATRCDVPCDTVTDDLKGGGEVPEDVKNTIFANANVAENALRDEEVFNTTKAPVDRSKVASADKNMIAVTAKMTDNANVHNDITAEDDDKHGFIKFPSEVTNTEKSNTQSNTEKLCSENMPVFSPQNADSEKIGHKIEGGEMTSLANSTDSKVKMPHIACNMGI